MKLKYSEITIIIFAVFYILLTLAIGVVIFINNLFVYEVLDKLRNVFVSPFLAGAVIGHFGMRRIKR